MSESKPMSVPEVKKLLKRNKKKAVLQTIENCLIVLRNDPTLQGAIRQNILTDRQDIVKDVGWVRSSTTITVTDYQYIMHYLEHNYGLAVEKKIQAAVKIIANENQFHPIRDYLSALRWDGEERLPYVLSKYLGADPCTYTTEVLKVFMLGAVSRVFQPGIKFDYMLCLAGGQGAGKSTFFRLLALKDEWFTDDLKHIDKDDVYVQMSGHWIIEMSEMLATANAKSIEEIKSFISRMKETYRTPYDKFPKDRQRQYVFGGTTNTLSFLPLDRTGNRRFLPVPLHREKAEIHLLADEPASRAYIEQLWAEVMEIYRSGNFSLDLSPEMEAEAERLRREFMPEDPKAGMIQAFLDSYTGKHVCTQLLYKDALKNEFSKPKDWELKEIGDIMNNSIVGWEKCSNQRYPEFGSQRSWHRIRKKEPVVDQLEITEGFPVIEDTDLPADWE